VILGKNENMLCNVRRLSLYIGTSAKAVIIINPETGQRDPGRNRELLGGLVERLDTYDDLVGQELAVLYVPTYARIRIRAPEFLYAPCVKRKDKAHAMQLSKCFFLFTMRLTNIYF
jgi:hypothetical protein